MIRIAMLALLTGLAATGPAATVDFVAGSSLNIELTGSEAAVVTVTGGNVKVNGMDPQIDGGPTGPVPASAVAAVYVGGGAGPNVIDFSGLAGSEALFTLSPSFSVYGNEGGDTITGASIGFWTVFPGAGADTVTLTTASNMVFCTFGEGSDDLSGVSALFLSTTAAGAFNVALGESGARTAVQVTGSVTETILHDARQFNMTFGSGPATVTKDPSFVGASPLSVMSIAPGFANTTTLLSDLPADILAHITDSRGALLQGTHHFEANPASTSDFTFTALLFGSIMADYSSAAGDAVLAIGNGSTTGTMTYNGFWRSYLSTGDDDDTFWASGPIDTEAGWIWVTPLGGSNFVDFRQLAGQSRVTHAFPFLPGPPGQTVFHGSTVGGYTELEFSNRAGERVQLKESGTPGRGLLAPVLASEGWSVDFADVGVVTFSCLQDMEARFEDVTAAGVEQIFVNSSFSSNVDVIMRAAPGLAVAFNDSNSGDSDRLIVYANSTNYTADPAPSGAAISPDFGDIVYTSVEVVEIRSPPASASAAWQLYH